MKDYQKRVKKEKTELDKKIGKLNDFLDNESFKKLDIDEQERLRTQRTLMKSYSEVLADRIEAFKDDLK